MKLYVILESGEKRKLKKIYRGTADGTPEELTEGTPEYTKAVNEAIRQGVLEVGS
jgi:hypothetical protein